MTYGKCSKILNTFLVLFSNKMLVIRAGVHKVLVRIANSRLLLRMHSDLGLHCLSMQATSVRNFRTADLDLHCFSKDDRSGFSFAKV